MSGSRKLLGAAVAMLLLALTSCAGISERALPDHTLVYTSEKESSLLHRFAPAYIIEGTDREYNRIGTPTASFSAKGEEIMVDPQTATIYTSVREFVTANDHYINLLYRVHFSRVPFSLVPFYLTAGKNVGLIAVITLDDRERPLLYTLVHTCGCYLAFIPTSHLPRNMWPDGWSSGRQMVYGEDLPGLLEVDAEAAERLAIHVRRATHRIQDARLATDDKLGRHRMLRVPLQPFSALERLPLSGGSTTSFFETEGVRKGYVKDSHKIWERLLMSWWALDWYVGEDKKLGRHRSDGTLFYTSLKPWNREESDLRDFPRFLRFWGWRL